MREAAWNVTDLCYRHPRSSGTAVSHVSAAIGADGLTAIIGPNGAGKSTFAHLLCGLLAPTSGTVALGGRSVASWRRDEFAREVAFVPQGEEGVFPLTVRQLVAMGRFPYLGAWQRADRADDARVMHALAQVDTEGLADRTMQTLSGGERQRVRVARALAQDASVLLLDEPTASLDIRYEIELFLLLRRLADTGLRVVVITHNLTLTARLADTAVLMAHGTLLALGTPHEVLTSPTLSSAYEWPIDVTPHHADDDTPFPLVLPKLVAPVRA